MIVLAAIDVEHMLLPDRLTLPGLALGLLFQLFIPWAAVSGAPWGRSSAAVSSSPSPAPGTCSAARRGWVWDVKMLAMVGAFLGWKGVIVTLFVSTLTGCRGDRRGAEERRGPQSQVPRPAPPRS